MPCFDGGVWQNKGHASFWRASHRALLEEAAPGLQQYFIYALEKETSDPLAFLSRPVEPERRSRLFAGTRNLWCTVIFGVMAGREVLHDGAKWSLAPRLNVPVAGQKPLFGFSEVELSVSDTGVVSYGKRPGSHAVRRFDVLDAEHYGPGMTEATAALLSTLVQPSER